jgi:hypothetical protein
MGRYVAFRYLLQNKALAIGGYMHQGSGLGVLGTCEALNTATATWYARRI